MKFDWRAHEAEFEWVDAMRGCPQDPIHHAEGDVWIHTRMVCEALVAQEDWQALPRDEQEFLYASALLHDVAKPMCTREENGRITARGHSQRGAIEARRILWEAGEDLAERERLCAMVRFHQVPFYLIERPDAVRMALLISQQTRCDHLALLARADALGRVCADQQELLTRIRLFEEHCRELGCLDRPWPFASALSRFEYFRREDRDRHYCVHDESRCEVTMMSGLPGSGKDTWLKKHAPHLPVISLDAIREELDAPATGNQGEVVQAAREEARVYLRAGRDFAWNATNLTRDIRTQLIDLFTGYGARTRIVYVEAPPEVLYERNQSRSRVVPQHAITHMLGRWDVPPVTEAATVEWWKDDSRR